MDEVTSKLVDAVRSIPLDEQMVNVVVALDTLRLHLDSIEVREAGLDEAAALHRVTLALYALQRHSAIVRNRLLRKLRATGITVPRMAAATGIERARLWKLLRRSDDGHGRGRAGDDE